MLRAFGGFCSPWVPLGDFRPQAPYLQILAKKGKGSPYSITERRVPELIPVLGSQPAGDMSHNPAVGCHYFPPVRSYPRNP